MEYTLDELVAAATERIGAAGLAQANGQVSPFPDRRTLRYYTTIGLLDRPHRVRDRQAVYGEGHLLQALAVKRLQAEGLALAEIQSRLSGLPMADVAAIADGQMVPVDRRPRFWAARADSGGAGPAAGGPTLTPPGPPGPPDQSPALPLLAISLAPDVTVLIPADRTLTPDELADIRHAAGPLLAHLAAAGLAGTDPKDRP